MVHELVIDGRVEPIVGDPEAMRRRLLLMASTHPDSLVFLRARYEDGRCVFLSGNHPPEDISHAALHVGA